MLLPVVPCYYYSAASVYWFKGIVFGRSFEVAGEPPTLQCDILPGDRGGLWEFHDPVVRGWSVVLDLLISSPNTTFVWQCHAELFLHDRVVEIIVMVLVYHADSAFGVGPCSPCLALSHAPSFTKILLNRIAPCNPIWFSRDSHMTTYILQRRPSIRKAEMEACSRGFPVVGPPQYPHSL